MSIATPLLSMRGICKSFPGVRALHNIDLELSRGKVLALLGENGAGKSTLIKILGGAHLPDAGTVEIDGQPAVIANPYAARSAGIGIIYQEFNLVPELTVRDNIFLGRIGGPLQFIRSTAERQEANQLFERIGVPIDPETICGTLSVAQQQIVEIAKALSLNARIIVMDEPSAALTLKEVEHLFTIVSELKAQNIGIIYISHRLDEIFDVADRVTVLRDGEHVGTDSIENMTRKKLIAWMVGRNVNEEFPKEKCNIGSERLVVRNLCRTRRVQNVSFSIRRGEVLGLTGLVGAGRTETARLIFGADQPTRGTIELDGQLLQLRQPRDAIRAGICLLSEDRKAEGLILEQSAQENFGLPNLERFSSFGILNHHTEHVAFRGYVDSLKIKIAHYDQHVNTLSGGNQQKIVLAKWLQRNAEVIIFDEPTRGIDIGAKYEIYLLMNQLAAQGKSILMISSELPEILGMSDRILVMHEGHIKGEIGDVAAATPEDIMHLAVGAKG